MNPLQLPYFMAATVGKIKSTAKKTVAFYFHNFTIIFSYVIWPYLLGYCCNLAQVSWNHNLLFGFKHVWPTRMFKFSNNFRLIWEKEERLGIRRWSPIALNSLAPPRGWTDNHYKINSKFNIIYMYMFIEFLEIFHSQK